MSDISDVGIGAHEISKSTKGTEETPYPHVKVNTKSCHVGVPLNINHISVACPK